MCGSDLRAADVAQWPDPPLRPIRRRRRRRCTAHIASLPRPHFVSFSQQHAVEIGLFAVRAVHRCDGVWCDRRRTRHSVVAVRAAAHSAQHSGCTLQLLCTQLLPPSAMAAPAIGSRGDGHPQLRRADTRDGPQSDDTTQAKRTTAVDLAGLTLRDVCACVFVRCV